MSRNKKFTKPEGFRTLDVPESAPTEPVSVPSAKETFIADGTQFEGTLRSKCGITLDGSLKGELKAPTLVINDSGDVNGKVDVEQLKSSGKVSGEIKADDVMLSGTVDDKTVIRAKTMEVKLAEKNNGLQVTFGNCELKVGGSDNENRGSQGSQNDRGNNNPGNNNPGNKHRHKGGL